MVVLQQIDRRPVGRLPRLGDRRVDRVDVVAVDVGDHVPAVGLEAPGRVVDEPGRDRAVDRDAVVVVERDQLVQLPGAGERAGLVADAFHQAAVADEDVGVVVDDRVAVAVELGGEQLFGQRHADRVGQALAERAGGGLDAGRDVDFGMARRLAVQLAEVAQLARSAGRSRSGAAARTAASSRGRWTARSGRGRASADWPGCGAGAGPTAPPRSRPCPSARRDGRSWPAAPRPSPAPGWRWPSASCALREAPPAPRSGCPGNRSRPFVRASVRR